MSNVFLEILTEVNDILQSDYFSPWRYQLASGNCGYVAIAMSKLLQKLDQDHCIRLYSHNIFNRNFTTWKECNDADLSGDHLICIHKDTWLDYTLNDSNKKESVFDWGYEYIDVKDKNMDSLRNFCESNTTPWIEYDKIEKLIFDAAKQKGLII